MELYSYSEAEKILGDLNPDKAQSFLLEGPEGAGKFEVAMKFAIKLLGNESRVRNDSHSDFLYLKRRVDEKTGKRKAEINVEDARKVSEFLHLTPAESSHRVCLINSADVLNSAAANSILKTLEEPPRRSVIILLSHGGRVLPTIRSRCTAIRFTPPSHAEFLQQLSNQIPDANEQDSKLLALISGNSIGLAEKIFYNDGMNVSRETLKIFSNFPNFDYKKASAFLTKTCKSPDSWEIFKVVLDWIIANIAKSTVKGHELEVESYNLNSRLQDFQGFLAAERKLEEDIKQAQIFNLDKKQVTLDILRCFSDCYK